MCKCVYMGRGIIYEEKWRRLYRRSIGIWVSEPRYYLRVIPKGEREYAYTTIYSNTPNNINNINIIKLEIYLNIEIIITFILQLYLY